MRRKTIIILFIFTFLIELLICTFLCERIESVNQDIVKVNECVKEIEENYNNEDNYCKILDYSIIDTNDKLIYHTKKSESNSLNDAIKNNDIILDLKVNNIVVGKILIKNNTNELINNYKNYIFITVFSDAIRTI